MIVAFSTSSPLSSVALFTDSGDLLAAGEELAPMGASGACLRLLDRLLSQAERTLEDATMFLSDLGPGSFTGVRVGVTLAKTLAYVHGTLAGGASSFDLVSTETTVVLPSKRSEWFVRRPGANLERVNELPSDPFLGYGAGIEDPIYPSARRFGSLFQELEMMDPQRLVPGYLLEPAISKPKQPYAQN